MGLLAWAFFTASAFAATNSVDANTLFKKLAPSILTVRVGIDEHSPRRSYGTGFAVDSNGSVITNFHVIDSAVYDPDTYKIFVEREGLVSKARVKRIDPVHNLALLETAFKPEVVPELTEEPPAKGEKLYSLGIPRDLGVGIAEGNFGGEVQLDPYRMLVLSMSLSSGMSGGPVVNGAGKIVGVNVSSIREEQNLTFAIPSQYVRKLLASTAALEIDPFFRSSQEALLASWRKQYGERLAHSEFRSLAPLKGLDCWRDRKSYGDVRNVDVQGCRSRFYFTVEGTPQGAVQVWHLEFENKAREKREAYRVLDDAFNGEYPFVSAYKKGTANQKHFTPPDCVEGNVINESGVELKSVVCMAALKRYGGATEALVRVMTMDPKVKRPLLVGMLLSGFDRTGVQEIVGRLLNSFERR